MTSRASDSGPTSPFLPRPCDRIRQRPRRCAERTSPALVALAALAALTLTAAAGCGGGAAQMPTWTTTSLDYGQGQVQLKTRFRWVMERDERGIELSTPEGGKANLHIFSCGQSQVEIKELIRQRLRGRLVGNELVERGRVLGLRYWQGSTEEGTPSAAAVAFHGPLLISISSATFDLDDLLAVAGRVRLTLPLATIPGCFPLCDKDTPCVPQAPDDG